MREEQRLNAPIPHGGFYTFPFYYFGPAVCKSRLHELFELDDCPKEIKLVLTDKPHPDGYPVQYLGFCEIRITYSNGETERVTVMDSVGKRLERFCDNASIDWAYLSVEVDDEH